jgi:hypothetical protein
MTLKKEPLDLDFVVESRPLTKQEELAISEFIKKDKTLRMGRSRELKKGSILKKSKSKVS